ncbi:SatD family protein [Aliifodinibius sp. S!AR15-10]|uniref:hypothetical protein n=1 Tax=Aliifodinibius sp. S!AR15-10 TaxID=2950437 RepID=UPI0028660ED4|nr:hypothetical protein [Aliifodinibius sp. S!AR15-10]MDR8392304.1 SatD family protein [Aliifodinibius sp. S!AR15-10]
MGNRLIYAVITGDLVDSSKVGQEHRELLINTLKESFKLTNSLNTDPENSISFDIYRGDSFQGVIPDPSLGLAASLVIRSSLRKAQPESSPVSWDARTAIGIGSINNLPEAVSEGDGEAYRRSGPHLDKMKPEQRLVINTPWKEVNDEMRPPAALLDAVIAKWSPPQAEIVLELLKDKSRITIGEEFGISQAAVHYRVKGAGWFAINQFLLRYKNIIQKKKTE